MGPGCQIFAHDGLRYIIGIDKYKCQMCLKIKCMKQKLALGEEYSPV